MKVTGYARIPTESSICGLRPTRPRAGISHTKNLRKIRLQAMSAAMKTAARVRKTCSLTRGFSTIRYSGDPRSGETRNNAP